MSDVVTSTYSNSSTGVREMSDTIFEDVEGVIQNISPKDTPFQASIGSGKATNTQHNWLEDTLQSATGTNAAVEGADATATTRTPPNKLSNYTQIWTDAFMVSGSMDAVNAIGRAEQSQYELTKSLSYLKTEMEYAIINNTAAVAGDASTARKTKGLSGFISTNDFSYSTYADTNDFDETKFMLMMEACYTAGGKPSVLMVPPKQSVVISAWDGAGKVTVNQDATTKTLTMAVMVLDTPFGVVNILMDKFIAPDIDTSPDPDVAYSRVFLYDPSMLSVAYLRRMKTTELAKVGDSTKYQTVVEAAFVCKAEKAHAKCAKCANPA